MKTLYILALTASTPSFAFAQAAIAGSVKDGSGVPLPGVIVQAASPALIERARLGRHRRPGQYRIEDLRPGIYTVTFTLSGWSPYQREGIELTGSFTATVDAELTVGPLDGSRSPSPARFPSSTSTAQPRDDAERRRHQVDSHGSQLQRAARARAGRRHQHERHRHGHGDHVSSRFTAAGPTKAASRSTD